MKTKTITIFGVALALWVVLSSFLHIPIGIGHLWIDMGYVVYGLMLALYGVPAAVIGVLGVFLENVLFTGWVSYSWMAGQLIIGLGCGYIFYKWKNKKWITYLIAAIVTWIGIGLIKTLIEIALGYGVFEVKIITNSIAAILDFIPMMIGYYLAKIPIIKKLALGNMENNRDLSFALQQNIGIYYQTREWADKIFDSIVESYPKKYIKQIRKSKDIDFRCIVLEDGSIIRFIGARESSRGFCFSKIIIEPGIDREIIETIIYPSLKHQNRLVMVYDEGDIKYE